MKDKTLKLVLSEKNNRNTIIVATELESGQQIILNNNDKNNQIYISAKSLIKQGKSDILKIDNQRWFINISLPPLRLVTVGAVHIAQPLAEIATIAGYEVTIIDPRAAFANNKRFPNINIVNEWPEEALIDFKIDNRTAVVTLTHDPKLDDSALYAALNSKAFYIGSLGSKKTHNARIERLKIAGFNEDAIKNIHGPVGLSIGAKSPQEIAISIMSELILCRHEFENNGKL
ncbi:MAG: xanthine dehydrogenase [Flavobacteriaceae bacterium]|nr:xanthine dehydrogenase [Flavobacteriaceae bacterium]